MSVRTGSTAANAGSTGTARGKSSPTAARSRDPSDDGGRSGGRGFAVSLDVFEGPFDLLLGLIAKHQLDVTEVALAKVTDDFIAHLRSLGTTWDLSQASDFLVVAATLLDMKAARLLPSADVEDEDALELLEARDLLFARLLQYRAYKQAAFDFAERMAAEAGRFPRSVTLEPRFAGLLPEVLLGIGPEDFAALAGRAMMPRPTPQVAIEHVHAALVSVREQSAVLVLRLRDAQSLTFSALIADADETLVVVARFLALLELFRDGAITFEQENALDELHVRWVAAADPAAVPATATSDFDDEAEEADSADADPRTAPSPPLPGTTTSQELS